MKKYSELIAELDGYVEEVFGTHKENFELIDNLQKTVKGILDNFYEDEGKHIFSVDEFIFFWHQRIVNSYQYGVYHTALKIHNSLRLEQGKGPFNSFEKNAEKDREVFIVEKMEQFKKLIEKIVLL